METSNIILSIIMASFCLLPVVLIYFNRKKTSQLMLHQLTQMAGIYNGAIDQFEICQNLIVGIDKANNFLFVAKRRVNEFDTYEVNLNQMTTCKVLDQGVKTTVNNVEEKRIERLDLEFIAVNPSQKPQRVNIYDQEESFMLNGELDLVRKWGKIVNDSIKGNKAI